MQKIPKVNLVETVKKKPIIILLSLHKTLFIKLLCRKTPKINLVETVKKKPIIILLLIRKILFIRLLYQKSFSTTVELMVCLVR